MQFLAFAKSGLANAACDARAETANTLTNLKRFIVFSPKLLPAAFYCVSADAPRAQIKRFNVVTQYRLSGSPILPQLRAHGHVVCKAM
jgi:hypothetical protein